jgi:hypothetical protein
MWDWRGANGRLKDISCRDMLRGLDAAGAIQLPKAQSCSRKAGSSDRIALMEHDTAPISCHLGALAPLRVEIAASKPDLAEFKSYISQYHYLGFDRSIGESMKYRVSSRDGRHLALLMFGASAWACAPRDRYIGWDARERRAGLHLTSDNTRFLIFPWVAVPHLASHALSLVERRLSRDWEAKYGHPVFLIETFVETARFRGVCYSADNWTRVGSTTGRGRNSTSMAAALPIKDVWVRPLRGDFREKLAAASGGGGGCGPVSNARPAEG